MWAPFDERRAKHGNSSTTAGVEVIEPLGAETIIGVRSADTLIMASLIAPEKVVKLDERVSLCADRKALCFLDAETEAAIQ
jgi:ABC-type sugar transport system ATPase subunit